MKLFIFTLSWLEFNKQQVRWEVPTSSGNWESLENHEKDQCMEISWNLKKKTWIIMEKSWDFVKKFDVTSSTNVCLTASFLATGGFKAWLFKNACMVYKPAYFNTLLLLLFTFMLRLVKMLLKRGFGWWWKIIEKAWNCVFEFLWEPWCMYLMTVPQIYSSTKTWERSGSVVECWGREATGWSFTGFTALWSLSMTHLS